MTPSDESRRLTDDVLPPLVEEPAVPLVLDQLFSWHRPRKQLVRENQWIRFARRLISREKGEPGLSVHGPSKPEVRYLTLPGIDYIDVRQLADLCRELECCLTSIGFQAGGEGNRHVARAQFREKTLIDAGHITEQSHTFGRRFEEVAHTGSPAYRDLRRRGPFHIVNIDACGSIARPTATHANRLVDALYKVVELQIELKGGPWLLFVTADARPQAIDRDTLDRLCKTIFDNADANKEFREKTVPLLSSEQTDLRTAVRVAAKHAGMRFIKLFALGLSKWFLDLAKSQDWDMKTHHPYCYSTTPRHDDTPTMACLAFEFLPPVAGISDKYGVARTGPKPASPRKDTAVRAACKVADMTNADEMIRSDRQLCARMTEKVRRYLEEAGYEREVLAKLESL